MLVDERVGVTAGKELRKLPEGIVIIPLKAVAGESSVAVERSLDTRMSLDFMLCFA